MLQSLIGAGGMGEVWRARDTRLGRTVAIKRLIDHVERFEQEARAISALNHPNICQIYDVGDDYLVLEYIEGETLKGPLPVEDAVRSALPIACALEEAHRRGILHRDLKPANILVTKSGTAKLLDFGLAKVLDKEVDITQTTDGVVVGTAPYMSPEQVEGRPADARSDVFSFGAVLYELLSGNRPFGGNSVIQVLAAVLHDEPRPLVTSGELHRVVMRCLRKRPDERFQTMADVRAALEAVLKNPAASEPSIAVLPFANLSADKDNEYFSDGLTEEIINALTRIPGLKVTARTSAFAFRGKEQDIRQIAEALDVRTVLEGSVRRAGNRIRVSAQLINATNGYHLWSERFDGELADVFAVQDEIASAIVKALRVTLSSGSESRVRYTPNLAAYEAYLKGLHEAQTVTPEGLARGQQLFEEAIALDPSFALAHSTLGFHFVQLANYGFLPPHDAMPRVRQEAEKAVAIDPTQPDGHAMLGLVAALYDYDWPEAERRFARAIAIDPVPCQVRRYYAHHFLLPIGRFDDAVNECLRAMRDDPLNVMGRVRYAQCLRAAGRMDDAYREMREALQLNERLWFTHMLLGQDQWLDERPRAEALEHAERAYALAPWSPSARGLLAGALQTSGSVERAQRLVETLKADNTCPTAFGLGIYHLICAEIDAAADHLERAIAGRHPAVFFLLHAHAAPLRHSHRWPGLAKLLNLAVS